MPGAKTPRSRRKKSQDLTTQSIDEDEVAVVMKQSSNDNLRPKSSNDNLRPRTPIERTVMLTVDGTEEQEPSVIKEAKMPPIPKTFYKAIDISFELEEVRNLEIVFSYTMVIRSIGRASPLFSFLLIGDQVLSVNDTIPMNADEFTGLITPGKQKIAVIRPWYVRHCDERKPAKYRKDSSYQIVEVYKMPAMRNGFEIRYKSRKLMVTKVHLGTRGAHAFTPGDRILDVDSERISQMDAHQVRKKFNATMKTQGVCSFLVERDLSLKSSHNASLSSSRAANVNTDNPSMGDDASEIGAREATRFMHMGKKYIPRPLLKDPETIMTVQTTECDEEGAQAARKKRKKKTKKKKGARSVSLDGKQETSRMPSDVKDEKALQKVTGQSGWSKFVRNFLQK